MNMVLLLALLLFAAPAAWARGSAEIRIYRCTDAAGKQTLRDTPCPKGQQQQVREMLRPKDAPARAVSPPRPAAAPGNREQEPTRFVVLAPPQAMYECTDPDGKRYTSDTGEGNQRWLPYLMPDYSIYDTYPRGNASRGSFRPPSSGNASVGRPQQSPVIPRLMHSRQHGYVPGPIVGGGEWIRDACAMLPPTETCARLRQRRSEIRSRFFNAMPSERDVLRLEERSINARLDNDCGAR